MQTIIVVNGRKKVKLNIKYYFPDIELRQDEIAIYCFAASKFMSTLAFVVLSILFVLMLYVIVNKFSVK